MSNKKDKNKKILKKSNPEEFWTLGDKLGQGTFGVVHKVTSKTQDAQIHAAKICTIEDQDVFNDTKLEVDILTRCDHENILKAFDSYYWDKKICMILEFCSGGALDEVTETVEGLDEITSRCVLHQALLGLQYLHDHCVIHRDIKAGNIMLTEKGICKIADFGVSAQLKTPEDRRNTFIGTPYWMAPEVILTQTQPHAKYDYKCDIYSLGITGIELVECQPPGEEFAPVQIMMYRMKSESPTFEEPGKWSQAFNDFVKASLSKDPSRRPSGRQCLELPWFQVPDIRSREPVVELFKIFKEFSGEGATKEEIIEDDGKSDEISDFDIDLQVSSAPSISLSEGPQRSVNKTVRKTIKYEINGVSKSKTITKKINDDVQARKEELKRLKEKNLKQMRVMRQDEARELAKIKSSHESYIADLIEKQKTEYESLTDRYKSESDNLQKNILKEVEKRRNAMKVELEKNLKRLKAVVDKERKTQNTAKKSKNKGKYDFNVLESDYIDKKREECLKSAQDMLMAQTKIFRQFYSEAVADKNKFLTETLKTILCSRLSQVLQVSQSYRNFICTQLETVLQHGIKYNLREISQTMKYMTNQEEDLLKSHLRTKKELPKNQKLVLKRELEAFKASLRKQRSKNERELLQKKQEEIKEKLYEEYELLLKKQEKEVESLKESHQKMLREIQDFHDQKNESTIRSYQLCFHERYQKDDVEFKTELVKLYNLKIAREVDFEAETHVAATASLDITNNLTIEMF